MICVCGCVCIVLCTCLCVVVSMCDVLKIGGMKEFGYLDCLYNFDAGLGMV